MDAILEARLQQAADRIQTARHLTAFCGAGISVESGIPPFRGEGGIWNRYDPSILDLDRFLQDPGRSWPVIKEMFLGHLGAGGEAAVCPNAAHRVLAKWEREGRLQTVITQNIDGLHAAAGSRNLVEFHGHCRRMTCLACGASAPLNAETTAADVPHCACGGLYKPDFVFFGEGIPTAALAEADEAASRTDCMLLIGTSGVVYPAASIPLLARRRGAFLIEINPEPTGYTESIVDIFLPLKAGDAFTRLDEHLKPMVQPEE